MPIYELDPSNSVSTDWEKHIRNHVQPNLGVTGGGERHHTVGTILLRGMYPLRRTLKLSPFQRIQGEFPISHHPGNSCGFYAEDDFEGDCLVEWELPAKNTYYSAFGAGMSDLHLKVKSGMIGARFVGSQQASGIENVFIRGYGEGGTGLLLAGDTYQLRNIYLDSLSSRSGMAVGSVGIGTWGYALTSVVAHNVTVHNSEIGVRLGDCKSVRFDHYETETTETPVQLAYNIRSGAFTNCRHLHCDRVLHIKRARWGKKGNDCLFEGMVDMNGQSNVLMENGTIHEVPDRYSFDIKDLL